MGGAVALSKESHQEGRHDVDDSGHHERSIGIEGAHRAHADHRSGQSGDHPAARGDGVAAQQVMFVQHRREHGPLGHEEQSTETEKHQDTGVETVVVGQSARPHGQGHEEDPPDHVGADEELPPVPPIDEDAEERSDQRIGDQGES